MCVHIAVVFKAVPNGNDPGAMDLIFRRSYGVNSVTWVGNLIMGKDFISLYPIEYYTHSSGGSTTLE